MQPAAWESEAAKKRGKRLGPPLKWSPEMAKKARLLMTKDGLNADELLGCSRCPGVLCSVA